MREEKDCLMLFRRDAVAGGRVSDAELDQVEAEVTALLDAAVEHAVAAESPGAADLLTDVYASY